MIEFGIIPTKYGYVAVGLRTTLCHRDTLLFRTPVPLHAYTIARITGKLHQELAQYSARAAKWGEPSLAALIWTFFGLSALVAAQIWTHARWILQCYTVCGGLWLFLYFRAKAPHWWRRSRLQKFLSGDQPVTIQKEPDWPTLNIIADARDNREYMQTMLTFFPETEPYYNQLLVSESPLSRYPFLSALRRCLRAFLFGPPIRLPTTTFHVGTLIQTTCTDGIEHHVA